ncbi:MAG: DUF327 family protein [Spirochaetes bacterium]|nr:DUF327 family protein [Spirochaetota bacterium]
MIIVNSTNAKKEENSKVKSGSKTGHVKSKDSFGRVLSEKISFEFAGAIDELLNDLKEEEKSFLEKQTYYHLSRYKSIVEKILKIIVDKGFETQKLKRLRKDRADFVIVDKINSKLLDISREITGRGNKAFNLLKAIEEIRGMVFDLLY